MCCVHVITELCTPKCAYCILQFNHMAATQYSFFYKQRNLNTSIRLQGSVFLALHILDVTIRGIVSQIFLAEGENVIK